MPPKVAGKKYGIAKPFNFNFMQLKRYALSCFLAGLLAVAQCYAQEDEFDFGDFQAAENTDIKTFCTNKVINLSPTRLISIGYDFVGGFDLESDLAGAAAERVRFNHGLRLDGNFPLLSKNNIIVNMAVRYWESRYPTGSSGTQPTLGRILSETPLRTSTVGFVVFKPLNEKHFFIVQAEAALNGNYNFQDVSPDFSQMKYSASALFGWKTNDYTNVAIGATRTYRGGRVLHIPVLLYNKTFNQTWGLEMLLPAYGSVRRNFSTKSFLKLGYELEGQSYLLQPQSGTEAFFNAASSNELRKSEIRPRISWDVALSDFVWLGFQAGMRVNYRFAVDLESASNAPIFDNNIGLPYYFGFSINLVSP